MDKPTLGFIGTGIMGEPMARHLVSAGYRLKVWNRSPEKLRSLIRFGAEACSDAAAAGCGVSALICMLSDGPTCDVVLLGDGGAVAAMSPGATVVVMSSIPVETAVAEARKCEERGVRYLDAPVSGGERGAQNATLAVMAGGKQEDFDTVKEILAVMGRPVRVGPVGCGQLAKIANQMIVASTIATVSEALLLAERGGADPAKIREALTGGFADSTILQQHGRRMIESDFKPGGPAKYQLKDTHTAVALAKSLGLSLPVIGLVDSLFQDLVAHGDGDLDHSALIRELRRRNGLPPNSPKA
ncbi:MAG TPA: NAD(P)-dependent oxidoreductase [Candidatus Aquilonibacter sp.]|nr:NAD(P)-dependent oxidoreductase [Candidatus Aquilonibacter sp.]